MNHPVNRRDVPLASSPYHLGIHGQIFEESRKFKSRKYQGVKKKCWSHLKPQTKENIKLSMCEENGKISKRTSA